jgi:uncharacterized protein RhaS with RHS repeats
MRDYDPTTGRYLQADPLGLVDGASVYGYVGQSPLRNIDPKGLEWLYLGPQPYIDSPYWSLDPSYKLPGGYRWTSICSNAQIVYHMDVRNHWHYYPTGEVTGGRKGPQSRYRNNSGDNHLYPPSWIEVCDCAPSGGGAMIFVLPGALIGGRGSPLKMMVGGPFDLY